MNVNSQQQGRCILLTQPHTTAVWLSFSMPTMTTTVSLARTTKTPVGPLWLSLTCLIYRPPQEGSMTLAQVHTTPITEQAHRLTHTDTLTHTLRQLACVTMYTIQVQCQSCKTGANAQRQWNIKQWTSFIENGRHTCIIPDTLHYSSKNCVVGTYSISKTFPRNTLGKTGKILVGTGATTREKGLRLPHVLPVCQARRSSDCMYPEEPQWCWKASHRWCRCPFTTSQ